MHLGRVQASLTLLSFFHGFSWLYCQAVGCLWFQARNGYACINRACLKLQTNARKSMRYKQGFCRFWFMLTQEFTGDPVFWMLQLYIVCERVGVSSRSARTRPMCWNRGHKWHNLGKNRVWRTFVRHTLRHALRHAYEARPLLFTKVWRTRRRKTDFLWSGLQENLFSIEEVRVYGGALAEACVSMNQNQQKKNPAIAWTPLIITRNEESSNRKST